MKNVRIATVIGLLAVFGMIMASCAPVPVAAPAAATQAPAQAAPAPAAAHKPVVGFIQRVMNAPYYVAMWDTMSKMALEQGFELVGVNSNVDTATHAKQVEDMIARKVDFVVINAVDPGTEKDVDQQLINAGIPISYIDTYVKDIPAVTVIRSDNFNIGRFAAKAMAERFAGKPIKLIILQGGPTDIEVGPDRFNGFLKGLEENGAKVDVVARGIGDYTHEKGLSLTEDLLVAHPDVNAIFANNDSMALGALAALQAAGRTDVLVSGIDGQKEAFAEIKKGGCTGQYVSTGLNSPVLAAQDSVNTALAIIKGEKKASDFQKTQFTKAVGIDCHNIDEYYDPKSIF
jgi:ribose transport system substrate-binding protein